MEDYEEVTRTVEVPANTGRRGFLHTIEELLKRPRIQSINIDARGVVTYRQFVVKGEDTTPIGVDFEDIAPSGVIRNAVVDELPIQPGANASTVIGYMMDRATQEQMYPVALVSGANTIFWDWYQVTSGMPVFARKRVFGLPFYGDRLIPDTALILCTAYGKDAAMIDTQRAYKVEMEYEIEEPPADNVEIVS